MNKVLLTGTVANPPRSYTTEATSKTKIELRVNDGKLHHTVIGWEGVGADIEEGDIVFVDGRLGYRSYEKDGNKVWVTEVTAQVIEKIAASDDPAIVQTTPAKAPPDDLGFD